MNSREKEWALNISEFSVGEYVIGKDGSLSLIVDKTNNSIEVYINKKVEEYSKTSGIFDIQ